MSRADSLRTPWRNGGGWTRSIAQRPEGAGLDGFAWRVSCAEIAADGPFSAFPGIWRQLMLVDGDSLTLVVEGERHDLGPEQSLGFSGDAQVSCHVRGRLPAVALNVMTRPGMATATLTLAAVDTGLVLTAPERGDLVMFALGPDTRVGPDVASIGRLEVAWCTRGEQVALFGHGRVAVVKVETTAAVTAP